MLVIAITINVEIQETLIRQFNRCHFVMARVLKQLFIQAVKINTFFTEFF